MVSISSHVRGWGGERQSQSRFHNFLSLFILKGVIQKCFTSEGRASGYLFTSEDQILRPCGGCSQGQDPGLGRLYGKSGGKLQSGEGIWKLGGK